MTTVHLNYMVNLMTYKVTRRGVNRFVWGIIESKPSWIELRKFQFGFPIFWEGNKNWTKPGSSDFVFCFVFSSIAVYCTSWEERGRAWRKGQAREWEKERGIKKRDGESRTLNCLRIFWVHAFSYGSFRLHNTMVSMVIPRAGLGAILTNPMKKNK